MKRAILLLSSACGASEPQTVTLAPAATTTTSAAPTASAAPSTTAQKTMANGPHCPIAFRLDPGGDCQNGDSQCVYPEGTCACYAPLHCGGAAPMPWRPGMHGRLVCTPSDPSTLRSDGCTVIPPKGGAPCDKPNQSCAYGECGWGKTTYTCTSGRWEVHPYHGPLPP